MPYSNVATIDDYVQPIVTRMQDLAERAEPAEVAAYLRAEAGVMRQAADRVEHAAKAFDV